MDRVTIIQAIYVFCERINLELSAKYADKILSVLMDGPRKWTQNRRALEFVKALSESWDPNDPPHPWLLDWCRWCEMPAVLIEANTLVACAGCHQSPKVWKRVREITAGVPKQVCSICGSPLRMYVRHEGDGEIVVQYGSCEKNAHSSVDRYLYEREKGEAHV